MNLLNILPNIRTKCLSEPSRDINYVYNSFEYTTTQLNIHTSFLDR